MRITIKSNCFINGAHLLAVTALLVACGGGGGNGGSNDPIPTTNSSNPVVISSSSVSSNQSNAVSSQSSAIPIDTTPDSFSFAPLTEVKASAKVVSNTITVTGISGPASVDISNGDYAIGAGPFSNFPGVVNNGDTVQVRQTSAAGSNVTAKTTLSIGGVSADFNVTTLTDTAPPTVKILFPTETSLTEVNSVLVRGTAHDNANDIVSVKINGLPATTSDGYANWQLSVPLVQGVNNLAVQVTDAANNANANAATLSVTKDVVLRSPTGLALDKTKNLVYVMDSDTFGYMQVVSIDLTNGKRTIVSDRYSSSLSTANYQGVGLVIDKTNNRLLTVDESNLKAVVAIDFASGRRSILSGAALPNQINAFVDPIGIALDESNHRALVADAGLRAIVAVDLASGARTILSENFNVHDIVLDSSHNRALVLSDASIIAVDLGTGARSILSDSSTPTSANGFRYPSVITLDEVKNRALIIDSGFNSLMSVDLTTGARSILTTSSLAYSFDAFINYPRAIALDSTRDQLLLTNQYSGTITGINLTSGNSHEVSTNVVPSSENALYDERAVKLDAVNNRLLVLDNLRKGLLSVDLKTGARKVLSEAMTQSGTLFGVLTDLTLDLPNNRAFVLDQVWSSGAAGFEGRILSVDLVTGERSIFSDSSTPNVNNVLSSPSALSLDLNHNRILVLCNLGVIAVDLNTRVRTILSDSVTPNSSTPFANPTKIVTDKGHNRALVVDAGLNSIIALDLESGARTIFSSATIPNGVVALGLPWGIDLDEVNNRALVTDWNYQGIISVDLESGARKLINANSFGASWILLDTTHNDRALVVDSRSREILAVDLKTGEFVVFSN